MFSNGDITAERDEYNLATVIHSPILDREGREDHEGKKRKCSGYAPISILSADVNDTNPKRKRGA